jgi:glycosyltransferase involved in cell wall biosynthesis
MKKGQRVIGMIAACPFPSSQGSQVLIRQLARSLSSRGHSVHVITYPFGDLPPDPDYTLHRAPSIIPCEKLDPGPSFAKPFLDILLLAKVASVVRREKIEILHGHNYEGIILAWKAARWLGIPVVYHCHSLLADELPFYFSGDGIRRIARTFGSVIDKFVLNIPDHVIAVSPEIVRDWVERSEEHGKITFIPPGICPEEWEDIYAEEEKRDYKANTVIFTGNLAPFQNIPQLLEVVRTVREEIPSISLSVITPSRTERLFDMAREQGVDKSLHVVRETDFRSIVPCLFGSDVACSTRTMKSGFPVKNLNYMAAGLPIVCYESGSKGVINGETGLVVEDDDVTAFAASVLILLKDGDLRKKMGYKAREIAFRDYNWQNLSEKIVEINELLILR